MGSILFRLANIPIDVTKKSLNDTRLFMENWAIWTVCERVLSLLINTNANLALLNPLTGLICNIPYKVTQTLARASIFLAMRF